MSEGAVSGATEMKKPEVTAIDYDIVKMIWIHVIRLAPDFVYGYYNRGKCIVHAERLSCGIGGLRQGNRTEPRLCRRHISIVA